MNPWSPSPCTVGAKRDSATPMEAVATALRAAGELLTDRELSGRRQSVIDSHPELRERELIKMASVAAGLAESFAHLRTLTTQTS